MKRSDFNFHLPEELIAQFPVAERSASRLLVVDGQRQAIQDSAFAQLIDFLNPGDLLVFNNTRVIPARLYGNKASGGKVEVLIERITSDNTALAQIRASKAPKPGSRLLLGRDKGTGFGIEVTGREGDLFALKFLLSEQQSIIQLLEDFGHIPLPPYVKRSDEETDFERYQTVYASEKGAVAAPTAGLHFDDEILQNIKAKGINSAFVTLHVGAGTYQPVRVDNINDHIMHSEYVQVSQETVDKIKQTQQRGNRVIAVGTTSLRSLESAAQNGSIERFDGDTDIFIYPGYRFKVIDALITNFHLPESTLFMLVSAFCGLETMKKAYQHAIDEKYRFFSYGDAMLLTPSELARKVGLVTDEGK